MKYLKNNFKIILAFFIGMILASGITVYASTILAREVIYKDNKSVEYALNDLYRIQNLNNAVVIPDFEVIGDNTLHTYDNVLNFEPSRVIFILDNESFNWGNKEDDKFYYTSAGSWHIGDNMGANSFDTTATGFKIKYDADFTATLVAIK